MVGLCLKHGDTAFGQGALLLDTGIHLLAGLAEERAAITPFNPKTGS
jgi:hypothetical protein